MIKESINPEDVLTLLEITYSSKYITIVQRNLIMSD
jgi:hypothetical protein